jgi:hypothetical protein
MESALFRNSNPLIAFDLESQLFSARRLSRAIATKNVELQRKVRERIRRPDPHNPLISQQNFGTQRAHFFRNSNPLIAFDLESQLFSARRLSRAVAAKNVELQRKVRERIREPNPHNHLISQQNFGTQRAYFFRNSNPLIAFDLESQLFSARRLSLKSVMFLLFTNITTHVIKRIFIMLHIIKAAVCPKAICFHIVHQFGESFKDALG